VPHDQQAHINRRAVRPAHDLNAALARLARTQPVSRRVLDRIEIELADHGGTDNGKLPVTYDDFVRYGIERHAIGPAIREVVALGFVEITAAGRAGNADWRKPNLFRLTFRNTKYAPTNEWQKITEEQAEPIARTARMAPPRKIKKPVRENAKSQWGKIVMKTKDVPPPGWDAHLQVDNYVEPPESEGMPPVDVIDTASGFKVLTNLLPQSGQRRIVGNGNGGDGDDSGG
jgi:hypothetical protein